MDYASALSQLEADGKTDVIEAIKAEFTKKNKEAETLRTRTKKAESRLDILKDKGGIDLDSDDFESEIEKLKGGKGKPADELQKQIAKLQKDFEAERTEKQAITKKLQDGKARQKLVELLKDTHTPDDYAEVLLGKVKHDGDNILFVDGENESPLDVGITGLLKGKPQWLKNPQRPGGGTQGGSGSAQNGLTATRAQLSDPEFFQTHIKEINSGKVTVIE